MLVFAASLLMAGAANAKDLPLMQVEGVISRGLLEHAAFAACAPLSNGQIKASDISAGWADELEAIAGLLNEAGFDPAFVGALPTRYKLTTAIPVFAEPDALTHYCAMLGDWPKRYLTFIYFIPQFEIKKALEQ